MATYKVKLLRKETIADGTMAFYFEKPAGFTYRAGQYVNIILIDPAETDGEGSSRNFSLASAPYEPELMVATRLRNTAFKRALAALPVGGELELEGPYGSFTLPKDPSKTAVFLAGGIGATFVRSITKQAVHEGSQHTQLFLYANRSPHEAVFMDEFSALSQQHQNFLFVPTMTQSEPGWTGEQGRITIDMLKKHVDDVAMAVYYLSGSAAMIVAMRTMLVAAGVNKFNIRSDQFIGY